VATNRTGRTTASPTAAHPSPTWNNDIVDGLAPQQGDQVIIKTTFGGFHLTDLDANLRAAGITSLLFTGCTTSVCVETTMREAAARRYDCVLLEDCVAEPIGANLARTNHDATVLLTELVLGWVSDSTRVVDALTDVEVHDGAARVEHRSDGHDESAATYAQPMP
jgi:ureidoacrylate peracid hydrolase